VKTRFQAFAFTGNLCRRYTAANSLWSMASLEEAVNPAVVHAVTAEAGLAALGLAEDFSPRYFFISGLLLASFVISHTHTLCSGGQNTVQLMTATVCSSPWKKPI
jgi:hypothetical protein